ncbi:MAG: hypothetical protein HQK57_12425, partial [Deltaproteobacteria bacterium]|nr:hypothetical protein [Deltaproteobacteria bacterium]
MTMDVPADEMSSMAVVDDSSSAVSEEDRWTADAVAMINEAEGAVNILGSRYLAVGRFLLERLLEADPKAVWSKEFSNDRIYLKLCNHPELSVPDAHISRMIKLAIQEKYLMEVMPDSVGISYSKKLELLRIQNNGPAKIQIARRCIDERLSTRQLGEAIDLVLERRSGSKVKSAVNHVKSLTSNSTNVFLNKLDALCERYFPDGDFSKSLFLGTLLYIFVPYLIFALGWLKIYYAIPLSIAVLYALYRAYRGFSLWAAKKKQAGPDTKKWFHVRSASNMGAVLLITLIWTSVSGVGGYGLQNTDYEKHNSMLKDLVVGTWPIHYKGVDLPTKESCAKVADPTTPLIYYISFYLPSALTGKMFGWKAANHCLFLWTWGGILLSGLWLMRIL